MSTTNKDCNHVKIYSKQLLLSNPPKVGWYCLNCGLKGYEIHTIAGEAGA
jgi:hypothetical protein